MKKILIVDDEQDILDLVEPMLAANDYEVLKARSGQEALRIAEASSPDLVLLDVMMPEMDGVETARRLKQNDKSSSIPIIMLTAVVKSDTVNSALEAGAVDYISKPFEPKTLLEKIRKALR
jgi:DNA-binding response OmpR family regulator